MSTEDVFTGLPGYDGDLQKMHEQEARERWGDDAVDASKQRTGSLSREEAGEVMAAHEQIARDLASLHGEGIDASDERVQAVVARHHAWVSTFWVPDAESYRGLAQMYVDDDRFRATYDAYGEGNAAYLRDAVEVYASTDLA